VVLGSTADISLNEMTVGKWFTHMFFSHRTVLFCTRDTSQKEVRPCGSEGDHMSGVTLVTG